MSVAKVLKSITKIKVQLEKIAEQQEGEIVYMEKRLEESKEERDAAKRIAANFEKLLS